MGRLSNIEKEFLLFMLESSIGTVKTVANTPDNKIAQKLYGRGLIKYQPPIIALPFMYYENYWSLTESGWKKAKSLKDQKDE